MNTTGKIIAGFLLGAVAGTVTSLLLAPSSGKTTRKNLNKKSKKLLKQIAGLINKKQATVHARSKTGKAQLSGSRGNKNGRTAIAH